MFCLLPTGSAPRTTGAIYSNVAVTVRSTEHRLSKYTYHSPYSRGRYPGEAVPSDVFNQKIAGQRLMRRICVQKTACQTEFVLRRAWIESISPLTHEVQVESSPAVATLPRVSFSNRLCLRDSHNRTDKPSVVATSICNRVVDELTPCWFTFTGRIPGLPVVTGHC